MLRPPCWVTSCCIFMLRLIPLDLHAFPHRPRKSMRHRTQHVAWVPNLCQAALIECGGYMKAILVTVAGLVTASPALADAVENAYTLCQAIDASGLSSSPCEVSGWSGSVTATMNTSSSEARKMCAGMVAMVTQRNIHFRGRQWTLQIKSPYSGDNTIAFCNLPE